MGLALKEAVLASMMGGRIDVCRVRIANGVVVGQVRWHLADLSDLRLLNERCSVALGFMAGLKKETC